MRYNKSIISSPNNPEIYDSKKSRNLDNFAKIEPEIVERSSKLTRIKLELANRPTEIKKTYDDDIVQTINDLFYDRVTVFPLLGDFMRATKVLLRFIEHPKSMSANAFISSTLNQIVT